LPYIRDLLRRLENGEGRKDFIPLLEEIGQHLWSSYCAFAPGAVAPLQSLLKHFREEVEEHIRQKRCPFKH
jgi:NADH-quinone oxidoreductase subunit F